MLEASDGLLLYLPHALAGQAELLAHLFQGQCRVPIEPEVQRNNVRLAPRERGERPLHLPAQGVMQQARIRRSSAFILQHIE